MELPFSQACENNKHPILEQLQRVLSAQEQVLEVGSGTGQHAIFFANELPDITWIACDLQINHDVISARIKQSDLNNLIGPFELDLMQPWHTTLADNTSLSNISTVFTANTLHIVSWSLVQRFFHSVSHVLKENQTLVIYGPFNYSGNFTSESNAEFDVWLKQRDPNSGIRDIEAITQLAAINHLLLQEDIAMPANNRLLVFKRGNR